MTIEPIDAESIRRAFLEINTSSEYIFNEYISSGVSDKRLLNYLELTCDNLQELLFKIQKKYE